MGLSSDELLALYDGHAREMLGYFASRVRNAEVAVELVGETFLSAFAAREHCRADGDALRAVWLYRIAANELTEHRRRAAAERRALGRLAAQLPRPLTDEECERIEQLASQRDLHARLERVMARLNDEQGRAIRCRVVGERSYAEVAEELGVTEQVARARVSRGLTFLRRRLGPLREGAR